MPAFFTSWSSNQMIKSIWLNSSDFFGQWSTFTYHLKSQLYFLLSNFFFKVFCMYRYFYENFKGNKFFLKGNRKLIFNYSLENGRKILKKICKTRSSWSRWRQALASVISNFLSTTPTFSTAAPRLELSSWWPDPMDLDPPGLLVFTPSLISSKNQWNLIPGHCWGP